MSELFKRLAKGESVEDGEVVKLVGKEVEAPGKLADLKKGIQVALEAYTETGSEARKIIEDDTHGGLENFSRLCSYYEQRTEAKCNQLRGEIMCMAGKLAKTPKEVRKLIVELDAIHQRLVNTSGERLQESWLKSVLLQLLDPNTKQHLGTQINQESITYTKAKDMVNDFILTTESNDKKSENGILDRI